MKTNFLDILLEAKKPGSVPKTKTIKIKPDEDGNDYSENAVDDEETTDDTNTEETSDDNEDTTDYTEEDTDAAPDDTADGSDNSDDEGDDTTDYTDNADDGDGGDDDTTDDNEGGGDDETDYTDGAGDGTGDDNSDGSDDNSDSGDNTEDTSGDESGEDDPEELNKNRMILDDFVNLYYLTKNSVVKLSNIDKTDIFINKIVTQVVANLNQIQQQLYEFITFTFAKSKYVNNLYQYNYFLQAFKINVEMLKKISIFMSN